MLKSVANRVSSIYEFYHLSYSQPSILKFNDHRIMSEEGPQQGDPLEGLLVFNTIHALLSQMKVDLVEGYMDDITLGGTRNDVATDVIKIRYEGGELGLHLNAKKMRANPTHLHKCRANVPRLRHYDAGQGTAPGCTTNRGTVTQRRCLCESRAIGRLSNAHAPLFPMFRQ